MLRISSAASGEQLLCLDAAHVDALVQGYGSTVGSLKRHLAERHFQKRYSRFQLRFLREGAPDELQDDENIMPLMDLQLMLMNHLPPDEDRDRLFLESCRAGRVGEVEQKLKGFQDPDVAPLVTILSRFYGSMSMFLLFMSCMFGEPAPKMQALGIGRCTLHVGLHRLQVRRMNMAMPCTLPCCGSTSRLCACCLKRAPPWSFRTIKASDPYTTRHPSTTWTSCDSWWPMARTRRLRDYSVAGEPYISPPLDI